MALAARPGPAAELITLSEAARLAGVHPATVRAWCARGDLPSIRHGRTRELRLRRVDVERLIDGARTAARERGADDSAPPAPSCASSAEPMRCVASPRSCPAPTPSSPSSRRSSTTRSACSTRTAPACGCGSRSWTIHSSSWRAASSPTAIEERVRAATKDSNLAGFEALRRETVLVFQDANDSGLTPEMRELYAESASSRCASCRPCSAAIRSRCSSSTTQRRTTGRPDETALARSFGDTIATAIGNARLMASVEDLAARLRAIQDLSARLSSDPGRAGHRRDDRRRGALAHRLRHGPRVSRRPRHRLVRADRLPGRRSWAGSIPSRSCSASGSARASPAGSPSTASRC